MHFVFQIHQTNLFWLALHNVKSIVEEARYADSTAMVGLFEVVSKVDGQLQLGIFPLVSELRLLWLYSRCVSRHNVPIAVGKLSVDDGALPREVKLNVALRAKLERGSSKFVQNVLIHVQPSVFVRQVGAWALL